MLLSLFSAFFAATRPLFLEAMFNQNKLKLQTLICSIHKQTIILLTQPLRRPFTCSVWNWELKAEELHDWYMTKFPYTFSKKPVYGYSYTLIFGILECQIWWHWILLRQLMFQLQSCTFGCTKNKTETYFITFKLRWKVARKLLVVRLWLAEKMSTIVKCLLRLKRVIKFLVQVGENSYDLHLNSLYVSIWRHKSVLILVVNFAVTEKPFCKKKIN